MNTAERILYAERRLAELETLGQSLDRIHGELSAYRQALADKLDRLRQPPLPVDVPLDMTPTTTAGAERRVDRRRAGNPISVIIMPADARTEPTSAWVTDRSAHGLGVWADEEEPIGSLLRVRPVKGTESGWWAQVVVRHCRHDRGRWVVGCQFVEQPPWNLLRAFG